MDDLIARAALDPELHAEQTLNALISLHAERDALRAALRECAACMDSLRDFVAEGGSRHMIGATDAIHAADRALEAAHPLYAAPRKEGERA